MKTENIIPVKCRGIILNGGKLFVVKHGEQTDFYALPGGHLEMSENPKECLEREIMEEFGIHTEVGRLLYVNNFLDKNRKVYYTEFFFEIKNTEDFLKIDMSSGIQKEEIFDIRWVSLDEKIKILPEKLHEDFKNGNLITNEVRFIN